MRCVNHPDRETATSCALCGRSICADCVIEDVGSDAVFCSESCKARASAGAPAGPPTESELLEGLDHPIAVGFALWRRSLPRLLNNAALPVAVLASVGAWFAEWWLHLWPEDSLASIAPLLLLIGVALGLIGIVLSREHLRQRSEGQILWLGRRFIPWIATVALCGILVIAGTFAFLLPGIYLSLRLFWADELALVHDIGPLRAIRSSWQLTRGLAGSVMRFQFLIGFAQLAVWLPAVIVLAFISNVVRTSDLSPVVLRSGTAAVVALVLVVAYAFSHACEIAFFYGMRAEAAIGEKREPPAGASRFPAMDAEGRTLCPHCGTPHRIEDYRQDAAVPLCSACRGELPR